MQTLKKNSLIQTVSNSLIKIKLACRSEDNLINFLLNVCQVLCFEMNFWMCSGHTRQYMVKTSIKTINYGYMVYAIKWQNRKKTTQLFWLQNISGTYLLM